jgi:two-component system sensor histidine kinase SenX3
MVEERTVESGVPPRLLAAAATPFPEDKRVLLVIADVTDARRLEAVRRDFVAAASHELKTPVSAILASSEALEMSLSRDPASAARLGQQLHSSARQLASLVSDLLDLSRLESVEQEQELVRLDQIGAGEVQAGKLQGETRGVGVVANLVPVTVRGSAADLGQAIRNLIDNAIRHTPPAGTVTIGVREWDNTAIVEVVDSGEGIPQRDLPRIFERFYRVDSARARTTGGTGLGLSIVRHVAETHGGSVTVESELGAGSTFRITLPIAR